MKTKKVYFTAIISKFLLILISLITSALINRSLGVSLKGEYSYIMNMVSIFSVILVFGMGQTYSTYRKKNGNKVLKYFVGISYIQFILTIIISIIFLFYGKFNWFVIGFLSATGLLKSNLLYYGAIEDVKKRDINNVFYKMCYLILVLIVYFIFRESLIAVLVITFIEDLIIILGTIFTFKLTFNFHGMRKNIKFKLLFKYGLLCMIMHCLMTLNYNLDIIFLKNICDNYCVGLYSVGVSLANMLWLIPDALKDVLVSKTSREDSISEIVTVTKYSLYFSIFIVIGFVVFGKIFINIFYGKEFLNSYFCTIILFIGCLSMVIYKLLHPIYISNGEQLYVVKVLFFSVITNVILNIILIPKFNIYGASVSSVFSYSLCSIIFLMNFCKKYNVRVSQFFVIKVCELNKLLRKNVK